MSRDTAWPTELRFRKNARQLRITFDDGHVGDIDFQLLREESPSAANKGHGKQKIKPRVPVSKMITVVNAEPVGRYGVRIEFSDGHKTGLYTWPLLRELSTRKN
ncbi:MAG: DUF971 domain-containing protein [Pseudomonadota bacterium]